MKKKLYFIFAFLILATSLVVWREPLSLNVTRLAFKYWSQKSFGEPLYFEKLKLERGKIILFEPKLGNELLTLDRGGLYLDASKAILSYDLNWLHKSLEIKIDLKEPNVKVVKTPEAYAIIQKLFKRKLNLFEVKASLRIDQGKLSLIDDSNIQKLDFNFEMKEISPGQEITHLSLLEGSSYVKGFIHRIKDNYDCKLDLEAVELSSLYTLANYSLDLIGKETIPSVETGGQLHGSLDLVFLPSHLPILHSRMEVHQFKMKNENQDFIAKAPKLSISVETLNRIHHQPHLTIEEKLNELIQNSFGSLSLPINSEIVFYSNKSEILRANKLRGKILFANRNPSKFNFEGEVEQSGQCTQFSMDGQGYFTNPRGDIQVKFQNKQERQAGLRISLDPQPNDLYKVFAQVENFTLPEISIFKTLFDPLYPEIKTLDFKEGQVDAKMHLFMKKRQISKLNMDHFSVKKISIGPLYHLKSTNQLNAHGNFSIDLSKDSPLKNLNGEVEFKAKAIEIPGHQIEEVEGASQVEEGKLKTSKIKASFSGIETYFDWQLDRKNEPLFLRLKGSGERFFDFIPKKISSCYEKDLNHQDLIFKIRGNIEKKGGHLVASCLINHADLIDFGFSFSKENKTWFSSKETDLFFRSFISQIKIAPTLSRLERPKLNAFRIDEGWFRAKKLPVEKYLSPLVFKNSTINCSGETDIEGTFNSDTIVLNYSNYHFLVDHFDVEIEIEDSGKEGGKHFYNLATGAHFGSVFVPTGTCLLKGSHLIFNDLNGTAHITSNRIYLPKLTSTSRQIELNGNVTIDFPGNGYFTLLVKEPDLKGNLTAFKAFIKVFGDSILDTLPLKGQIKINPNYGYFLLKKEGEYIQELDVQGELTQGATLLENSFSIFNLESDFGYNSKESLFQLKNLRGQWKQPKGSPLLLQSHFFQLHLNSQTPSPFDLRIKDTYKDQARLKGKLSLIGTSNQPSIKIILDAPKNHIGNVALNRANLTLNQGLEYFHLDFTTDLNLFGQDLMLFNQMFPHQMLSTALLLKEKELHGKVSGQWIYNRSEEKHQFFAWGDQVRLGGKTACPFHLKGHSHKGFIYLDQFQYQKYRGSFKLEEKPLSYLIHDFRIQEEDSLYLDLSGTYCKIFNTFKTHIHKLNCQLEAFSKRGLPNIECLGKVDLKGTFEGGFFKKGWSFELGLNGATSGLKISDFLFESNPIELKLQMRPNCYNFHYLKGDLKKAYHHLLPLSFIIHNLEFKSNQGLSHLEKLDFKLPCQNLDSVEQILKDKIDLSLPADLLKIKANGDIEGSLTYYPIQNPYALRLTLKDDSYTFKNKTFNLEDLYLKYGNKGILIGGKVHYQNKPYWIDVQRDFCMPDLLSCALFEKNPSQYSKDQNPHVTLKSSLQKKGPLLFQSLHGSIGGIKVDFVHRPEKDTLAHRVFMGQVQVKGGEFLNRLSFSTAQLLKKFGVGCGYFLSGQLSLNPHDYNTFLFEGLLGGRDFNFLGYEFKSLSSTVHLNSNELLIKDLKLSDLSGEGHVREIKIKKEEGLYKLHLPHMTLKNFKPSLLHAKGEGPIKHKPLIIESLELNDLKGNLHDPKTLTGSGSLQFLKSPKKQSSLLNIPGHILSKIGLDLTMLNPVEGRVLYEIKDEKIQLNRFVEVYSHDRNCHFQLAKSQPGSYIDFDGKLNVRIKMKQYVLLKFTEPFIISIQGNVFNPKYSFRRKKLKVDVPQTRSY